MNEFDKRNGKKSFIVIILIILVVLLLFGSLLYFTFRLVGDEKQEILDKVLEVEDGQSSSAILNLSTFRELKGATAEVKAKVVKETAQASTSRPAPGNIGDMKIRSAATEKEKLINELAYKLAANAFEKVSPKNWPSSYQDPLILMAQASTESLTIADLKVAYSSAIPNSGLSDSEYKEDYLLAFNTANAYKYSKMVSFQASNTAFVGMAQFSQAYGVSTGNYDRSILNYTDEKSVVTSDSNALSVKNSRLSRVKLRTSKDGKKTGDRFNWHDTSIQQVGKYDWVLKHKANTEIAKRVNNIYSFTAYIAMMHNIGEGVQTTGPNQKRKSFMRNGGTNTDVAMWAEFLGTDAVVNELDVLAQQIYSGFQTGGNAARHLTDDEMLKILQSHGQGLRNYNEYVNILSSGRGSSLSQNKEKVMHPAKMLLHYLTLQKHYGGGN